MTRPITLVTGQWADLKLTDLAAKAARWGFDGLEPGSYGGHVEFNKAALDREYCKKWLDIFKRNNLNVFAVSAHIIGQMVCDPNDDSRTDVFVPPDCAGNPEKKRHWAVETMKNAARAAKNIGVKIVTGFTGSSIWNLLYKWPPTSDEMISQGFDYFAKMWNPILDVFDECGVKFALEVHPTEIAFDIITAKRAIQAVESREAFGFNFDPSHLLWQMIEPANFLKEFPDRIYHVHMKDAALQLDGRSGILSSHLNFGHAERGWDFRSLGHGDVNFENIIRKLNHIGYDGPLSIEWEDCGMEREHGTKESLEFVKKINFKSSRTIFDAAFGI